MGHMEEEEEVDMEWEEDLDKARQVDRDMEEEVEDIIMEEEEDPTTQHQLSDNWGEVLDQLILNPLLRSITQTCSKSKEGHKEGRLIIYKKGNGT